MSADPKLIHALACALINAHLDADCWDSIPETEFDEWLRDAQWALMAVEARQARQRMLFSARQRFDDALRPATAGGATIAYPDAMYHAGEDDLRRALEAATPNQTGEVDRT